MEGILFLAGVVIFILVFANSGLGRGGGGGGGGCGGCGGGG